MADLQDLERIVDVVLSKGGDESAGGAIATFISAASDLVEEFERHALEGKYGAFPEGWNQRVQDLIAQAEADILKGTSPVPAAKPACDDGPSTSASKFGLREVSDVGPAISARKGSVILQELGRRNERKFVLHEVSGTLGELLDDIEALQCLAEVEMAPLRVVQRQRKHRKPSQMSYLSILETESAILTSLASQINDLLGNPNPNKVQDVLPEDVLQKELDAIPVQLQAVFNAQSLEHEQAAGQIDDKTMVEMAGDSQKRTEMVHNIERVLAEKKRLVLIIQSYVK